MKYYPVFLDLNSKPVVVVGGGKVAERKVRSLIKAGAFVKVISPETTGNLDKLRDKGLIKLIKRNFRKGDLKDAFLVVAATSSADINAKVANEAKYLVNVVNAPSEGNFIVPSAVNRGPLTMAISTGGISPAVSRAIRKELELQYNDNFSDYLRFVESIRKLAKEKIADNNKREQFLKSLASPAFFNELRSKGFKTISEKILSKLAIEKLPS